MAEFRGLPANLPNILSQVDDYIRRDRAASDLALVHSCLVISRGPTVSSALRNAADCTDVVSVNTGSYPFMSVMNGIGSARPA